LADVRITNDYDIASLERKVYKALMGGTSDAR
jgi:hypothetical protein